MAHWFATLFLLSVLLSVVQSVDVTILKPQQFLPQVVFQCGYRSKYLTKNGEWATDKDLRADCITGKLDILKYCRKIYNEYEITNIVEVSHYFQINDWCKIDGESCKYNLWAKPFRCIVGEFESEALLVPENCHFGHVDDRSQCKDFDFWNRTAELQCSKLPEASNVQSFAMLEPCGLDMFSGVEYVCCPKNAVKKLTKPSMDIRVKLQDKNVTKYADDEDDEDDDDDDDDDEEDGVIDEDDGQATATVKLDVAKILKQKIFKTSTTTSTTAPTSTTTKAKSDDEDDDEDEDSDEDDSESAEQDPYFRVADLDREHDNYREALARLEKKHREKVATVMNDWSNLETKYQEMRNKDPKKAQEFRTDMTTRFQRTVANLESQTRDVRRKFDDVHQQRINASFNERRRQVLKEYRDVLSVRNPSARKTLHALQAFIRVEEKDRVHLLNRYRHLLRTDIDLANEMRPDLLKKLVDMDTIINDTVNMLKFSSTLEQKVKPAALEFWQTFREEQTPDVDDDTILWIGDAINNDKLLSFYEKQYSNDDKNKIVKSSDKLEIAVDTFAAPKPSPSAPKVGHIPLKKVEITNKQMADALIPIVDKVKDNHYIDDPKITDSFALNDRLQHQPTFEEDLFASNSISNGKRYYGFVLFGLAGVAVLVVLAFGIAVIKRRFSARGQGFVEVDACTPEERHVAGMQVNGYENPTYKYFDDRA